MIAYVFWHWPRPDVSAAAYERLQHAFHEALARAPSPGFTGSASAALQGAPWANQGGRAYEDWYWLHDSAALDPLNDAAVTASRQRAHAAAAAAAHGGTAGLYALRLGAPLPSPQHGYWFAKPAGVRYEEVWQALQPVIETAQAALWMRRMVLGPAPEFCLQTEHGIDLPTGYPALHVPLAPLWPAEAP